MRPYEGGNQIATGVEDEGGGQYHRALCAQLRCGIGRQCGELDLEFCELGGKRFAAQPVVIDAQDSDVAATLVKGIELGNLFYAGFAPCLLYTSDAADDEYNV